MLMNPFWSMEGIEEIDQEAYKLRVYADRPHNLDQALRNSTKRFPHREAMVIGGERFSYEVFEEKVDRVASALSENLGVEPGDRVAFLMNNHRLWPITFMAIARIGAISVPLNTRLQGPELAYQVNNSQSSVLISDQEFLDRIELVWKDLKYLRELVVNGQDNPNGGRLFEEFEAFPSRNIVIHRSEDDIACIVYTSGTTGFPKGAMLTQRNMISIAMCLADMLQHNEYDRMLFFVPLFHVTGLIGMFLPMIIKGGANVILSGFRRHEIPKVIEEERITTTVGVPATFVLMMDSSNYTKYSRSTMRSILCGGAPSHPDMYEQVTKTLPSDCIFAEGYGLTEASSNVTTMPIYKDRRVIHHHGTVGVANPLADLRVVDDNGRNLPDGETGELLVRGPGVMKGYWNAPDMTTGAIQDGWLFTGDLVSRDKGGYITIMGRKKHMIIRGGENIYPVEIENVLCSHPRILEAAVAGIPDRIMGEEVKAVIVLKEGEVLNVDHIIEFLKPRLADYKIPKYFSFVQELPRNPGGKVMVAKLVDL